MIRLARKYLLPLALAATIACALSCGSRRHTVLLFTVAGLRADAVGADTMPRLSAWTEEGGTAEAWSSAPDTVLALSTLMTGRATDRLGSRHGDLARIPPDAVTLAEAFRERGYRTAAFLGDAQLSPRSGLARGFDLWLAPGETGAGAVDAGRLADLVGSHLRRVQLERRNFVWVHFGDLERVLMSERPADAWDAALAELDAAVAYVEDALTTFGLRDSTEIAFVSLHGAALGAGGEVRYGLTLDPAVTRVPVVVPRPGGHDEAGTGSPRDLAAVGRLLIRSVNGRGAEAAAEPSLMRTFAPDRHYGWPPLGAVGDGRGWLRVDPEPSWEPADGGSSGGWEDAPADLRERLEQAGFDASETEPRQPDPAARSTVLDNVREGWFEISSGDREAAAASLRAAIEVDPGVFAPRLLLLRVSAPAERAGAIPELEQMAASDPARALDLAEALIDAGEREAALRVLGSREFGRLGAGERLAAAALFEDLSAFEDSIALVSSVAEQESSAPELQLWMGDLALAAGNGFQARVAYEAALEQSRSRPARVVARLGDALASLGRDDDALQKYAEALELDPTLSEPHLGAARIFVRRGEAGAAADALIKSVPASGDAVVDCLAAASRLQAAGLPGPARGVLEAQLARTPDAVELSLALARVHASQTDYDAARTILRPLSSRPTEHPEAVYELARVETAAGSTREAASLLRGLEIPPGDPLARRVARESLFLAAGGELEAVARSFGRRPGPP
jgi:tetratricopeptide (TPR) repeat protein